MMKRLAALLIFSATPAMAHTGHGPVEGALNGFLHPFSGFDHVLAMVTVGLLAGAVPRLGLRLPAAFLAAMLAGFLLQSLGGGLPFAELAVAGSVLALGLALAAGGGAPLLAIVAATAVFGFFHGYVHGAEADGNGLAGYGLGFLAATLALHVIGFGLARAAGLSGAGMRRAALGGLIATAGAALVLAQAA